MAALGSEWAGSQGEECGNGLSCVFLVAPCKREGVWGILEVKGGQSIKRGVRVGGGGGCGPFEGRRAARKVGGKGPRGG